MTGRIITSIIILTKNRSHLLAKNFDSLIKQSIKPDEIIVIDNSSTDQTFQIIKKYQKSLPLRNFKSYASGYSKLYNFGIQKASGNLICFLDDDCLAGKNWLRYLVKKHQQYPNDIIQGNTFSLPKNNLFAEIMGNHYQNWLKSNLINNEELKFLDNKNLAVPKKIIKKYGGFSLKQNLGSEDIEFGLRMRKNRVRIIFQPKAIAWHHERDNFKDFIKQHYRIAQSESCLDKNLKNKEKIGLFPKKKTSMNLYSAFQEERNYFSQKKWAKVLKIPFIYLILLIVRLSGYLKKQ
jgi:O-antigen biosynthesis protein